MGVSNHTSQRYTWNAHSNTSGHNSVMYYAMPRTELLFLLWIWCRFTVMYFFQQQRRIFRYIYKFTDMVK